jgi:hypothetical protein
MLNGPPARRRRDQPCAQSQGVAVHWHWAAQPQAFSWAACWQPHSQAAQVQVAHWQFDWVVVFMAFLLKWLKETPV